MGSKVKTDRVRKGFKKLEKDPAIAALAVGVYTYPMDVGLAAQASLVRWAPNSEEWLARKKAKGWGQVPWNRTGKTLKGVQGNKPTKLGTKKGMKLGVNWRNAVAYLVPRTFTDRNGKRLPTARQDQVFNTLKRGGVLAKLSRSAARRGESLMDALAGAVGLVATDRRVKQAERGRLGIPARPLFSWVRSWDSVIEKNVDRVVRQLLANAGFETRAR